MSPRSARSRRSVLAASVAALALVATSCAAAAEASEHEVWSLDQGTDRIHIYDADHEQVAVIDVSPSALQEVNPDFDPEPGRTVPHMIDFDSQERYAFVAATAGAATIVIDTVHRSVEAVLLTGGGSHMAAVTPDDGAVWVAAIGAQQLVEIPLDLDADEPTFEIGRTIDVEGLLADTAYDWPSFSPVCHDYDGDGRAWITLGPGIEQGGLFVFDTDTAEVVHAYDPTEVRANCGIGFTDDDTRAVANWSGMFGADIEDGEGEWYVFDTDTFALLQTDSSDGVDAHGVRLAPDGAAFWQVNRGTSDGQIIDADSFEVIGTLDAGDTPDILDFSPDGSLAYITQRGPNPLSGDPHVAVGAQPGVLVVDVATGEHLERLNPTTVTDDEGLVLNDVHGIGVRSVTGDERVVVAAPVAVGAGFTFNCHLGVAGSAGV
ncbi:MAG: YncE family protein [Nitriliruptoraceae bacterium]|nr:YncE family protein [Nitriliruptoraceae bacterium]